MVHQSINTSDDDASDISNVLSVKRSRQIQVCQRYLFQHANPLTPLMMMLQTSAMSFQLRGLVRFKSVNATFFSMPITPINNR